MVSNKHPSQLRMVEAIYTGSCERFEVEMYSCAQTEIEGKPTAQMFPDLVGHLAQCTDCAEVYQDLIVLLQAQKSGKWIEPDEVPLLALPWEEYEADREKRVVQRLLDRGIVRAWMDRQHKSLTRMIVDLSEMEFDGLSAQFRQLKEGYAQEPEEDLLVDLAGVPSMQNIQLRASLMTDRAAVDKYELRVEISLPKRWPDFSGVHVILHVDGGQDREQTTGPSGLAQFSGLTREEVDSAHVEISLPVG